MPESSTITSLCTPWPEGGVEPVPICPVCASTHHRTLHAGLTDRIFYCAPGEWSLFECIDCGSGYLDPRPTRETMHLAYENYYTHTPPANDVSVSLGTFRQLCRKLANSYRSWRFGSDSQSTNSLWAVVAWLIPGLLCVLEYRYRTLPRPRQGARLLDVGFGDGTFLETAKEAGWQVAGADTDPVTVDSAAMRGLEVRQGGIEVFTDMPGCFDVITLSHVIEHVHDVRAVLRDAYRLLKPGGRLWLDTPNIDSYGHRRFGRHWRGLEPPRHLVVFNWQSLERVLIEEGFQLDRRLARFDVYPGLAGKSRAIAAGRDPYQRHTNTWTERISGWLVCFWTLFNYRRSEFVTLMTVKPETNGSAGE